MPKNDVVFLVEGGEIFVFA